MVLRYEAFGCVQKGIVSLLYHVAWGGGTFATNLLQRSEEKGRFLTRYMQRVKNKQHFM